MRLSDVLRAHLGEPLPPAVEDQLASRVAAARAAWPAVTLDKATFGAWLAERLPRDRDLAEALAEATAADRWLACACAAGDAAALAVLEKQLLPQIRRGLARLITRDGLDEDALQILRHKLFVEQPPKILAYRGDGPLASWLRVCATREILELRRRARPTAPPEDAERLVSPVADPELAVLRKRHAEHFRRAFVQALAGLTARERNVLRHQLVDRLRLDEIGDLYGVHHVTVARWLAKARRDLLAATQRHLREGLRLSPSELVSLLRVVQSDLDLSVGRLLGEADGDG